MQVHQPHLPPWAISYARAGERSWRMPADSPQAISRIAYFVDSPAATTPTLSLASDSPIDVVIVSPADAADMSVTLHTTHGDLKVELFCQATPKTSYNFLALCASGAYDGSPFHRLIPSFMVQGGSPAGGTPKDNMAIYGDNFEDEIKSSLRHDKRGMVSMANKGPGTNGSQFFLTFASTPHLDGKNTVFGRVLEGWDALDAIEAVPVDKKSRPQETVKIEKVTMHANPLADER